MFFIIYLKTSPFLTFSAPEVQKKIYLGYKT